MSVVHPARYLELLRKSHASKVKDSTLFWLGDSFPGVFTGISDNPEFTCREDFIVGQSTASPYSKTLELRLYHNNRAAYDSIGWRKELKQLLPSDKEEFEDHEHQRRYWNVRSAFTQRIGNVHDDALFVFYYSKMPSIPKRDKINYFGIKLIVRADKGAFNIDNLRVSTPRDDSPVDQKNVGEIEDIYLRCEGDYRPILHRLFDLALMGFEHRCLSTVPRVKHSLPQPLERVVNALFSEADSEQIKNHMIAQRFAWSNQYASVPKLNVGLKKVPDVGQSDALPDSFVMNVAPLLVESLSSLNAMGRQAAEALVALRLTNYFLHTTGYQRNSRKARAIIRALNKER